MDTPQPGNARRLVLAIDERIKSAAEAVTKNPFEQTVDEQIEELRIQNKAGNWNIPKEVFDRLVKTAPAWPKGKDAYRSLRIRWGDGAQGVTLTFERHWKAMQRVHINNWRDSLLHSRPMSYHGQDVERLRLLNGDETHHAVVEWVIVKDLSANRKRKDIKSLRGPQSLADEGLVLAWLFPRRVEDIDYDKWCAWYCGGYEVNAPEHRNGEWQYVVAVRLGSVSGGVSLDIHWLRIGNPCVSLPPLG